MKPSTTTTLTEDEQQKAAAARAKAARKQPDENSCKYNRVLIMIKFSTHLTQWAL